MICFTDEDNQLSSMFESDDQQPAIPVSLFTSYIVRNNCNLKSGEDRVVEDGVRGRGEERQIMIEYED